MSSLLRAQSDFVCSTIESMFELFQASIFAGWAAANATTAVNTTINLFIADDIDLCYDINKSDPIGGEN